MRVSIWNRRRSEAIGHFAFLYLLYDAGISEIRSPQTECTFVMSVTSDGCNVCASADSSSLSAHAVSERVLAGHLQSRS